MTSQTRPIPTPTNQRLRGRVAVVTGAANGIGAALATRLAADGAAVALVDLTESAATSAAITEVGGTATVFTADVSDGSAITGVATGIREALGEVDIVVNNAGIYPRIDLLDVSLADWRHVFAVNVESQLHTIQAFAPGMKSKGWGRIVNIVSNSVGLQVPGATHYIASKMAVVGLTRGAATELGEFGVTVNAVAPSVVRTPGSAALPEEGFRALAQMQTIKRTQVPADLVGTVSFLASDDAAFITGQTLYVDGGLIRSL